MSDTAVVCGATGGLGPSLVAHFAGRGDRVVAIAREEGGLAELVARTPDAVTSVGADLTDPDAVAAVWQRFDENGVHPRWLVNAVGGYRAGTVEESTPESVAFMRELNLGTVWWSCRSAVPRMKGSHGCIVNVAARPAVTGGAEAAAYAVAKAGVIRLTEVLAEELLEEDLRVNAVSPSIIDTPGNAGMPESVLAKAVPPEDIAAVVGFLCSDAAAPITGGVVPVYGRFPKPYRRAPAEGLGGGEDLGG